MLYIALLIQFGFALSPSHKVYSFSSNGSPKYTKDFKQFEFADESVVDHGSITWGQIGSFDTLKPFSRRGTVPNRVLQYTLNRLSYRPSDDYFAAYPLVAQDFELADDKTWLIINLRSQAHWNDGTPITAQDVADSFEYLMDIDSQINFRMQYSGVDRVEVLDPHRVIFYFKNGLNRDLPLDVATLPLVSKIPFKGSGPYKITKYEYGRNITLEKVDNYWAKDLPSQKGLYHFKKIIFEYFRDSVVFFEAFRGGVFDFMFDVNPKSWTYDFNFPAAKEGKVLHAQVPWEGSQYPNAIVFNLRKPQFQNRNVRKALTELFDFETYNHLFNYDSYKRPVSFFNGSKDLMATEMPSQKELEILNPLRDLIPAEVFQSPFNYKEHVSSRFHKSAALNQLLNSGYEYTKNGSILRDARTKVPFRFELLLDEPEKERIALSYRQTLAKMGIEMSVRTVDKAQYVAVTKNFDYDAIWEYMPGSDSPGNRLINSLHSDSADSLGSDNYGGIKDKAVDTLVEKMVAAKNRDEQVVIAHALDRVLMWNYYFLGTDTSDFNRVAYWNRFAWVNKTLKGWIDPIAEWWATDTH